MLDTTWKCYYEHKPKGKIIIDNPLFSRYNVITMITTFIQIGNSRGIRIPKPLLNESALEGEVELVVKKGEIKIIPAPKKNKMIKESILLSEKALITDWINPEEDKAWESLQ